MIVDVNAYLGHFAFRRLRHNTAASLLALMDSKKIDKAVVSSADAITYRNAQAGNEEVAAETSGHRDRLIPFAVINPFYAGWRDDLKICREEFGMTGLRLYPKWHNYRLSDPCCRELVADLQADGPIRRDWPNFSSLGRDRFHCHLTHRYVACWTCKKGEIVIEVYYVGSREKAPY